MILAVNTAQRTHELALIDGDDILIERQWEAARDDLDRLIPTMEEMLSETGLDKKEITDIAVVNGPGSFTAVRTGVAFANALAEGLDARLHQIDTFTLLREKAATAADILVVLHAGGLDVGVLEGHEVKVGPIAELLADHTHNAFHVVSECTETQSTELKGICLEKGWKQIEGHELQSMAEAILTSGLDVFSLVDTVEPYYLKSPVITKSTNKWKQA